MPDAKPFALYIYDHGLTIRALAAAAGISYQTCHAAVAYGRRIRPSTAGKLAKALHLTIEDVRLMGEAQRAIEAAKAAEERP